MIKGILKKGLGMMLPFYLIAFSPLTASAQKFALMDMEYIMKNIPAWQRANEQIEQASKKWQAEVEVLNNEAATMYKNYQNEAVFLSNEQKKAKQEAIMNKEKEAADLRKKYFGPEGELFKKRGSLITPIQEDIYQVVKEISELRGTASYSTVRALPPSSLAVLRLTSATKCSINWDIPQDKT